MIKRVVCMLAMLAVLLCMMSCANDKKADDSVYTRPSIPEADVGKNDKSDGIRKEPVDQALPDESNEPEKLPQKEEEPLQENESDNTSLEQLRDRMSEQRAIFAVAYLGCFGDGGFDEVKSYIVSSEYAGIYSFMQDIEEADYVELAGDEVYCVVPFNEQVKLEVAECYMDEDTGYDLIAGNSIYSEANGSPILVKGNVSDIVSNISIKVSMGEKTIVYEPSISLKDGSVTLPGENAMDFTIYN